VEGLAKELGTEVAPPDPLLLTAAFNHWGYAGKAHEFISRGPKQVVMFWLKLKLTRLAKFRRHALSVDILYCAKSLSKPRADGSLLPVQPMTNERPNLHSRFRSSQTRLLAWIEALFSIRLIVSR